MLKTNACKLQVGCVLLKEQPNSRNGQVGFGFCSLAKAEQAYNTAQKEFLAIVWSLLLLGPYLEGTKFTIRTDQDSPR